MTAMIDKYKADKRKHLLMFAFIIMTSCICLFTFDHIALAESNTYAKNLSDWVHDGVKVIATVAVAAFAVKFLMKRQFVQLLGFMALAAIILAIVYNPDSLKTIGEYLMKTVFGT